MALIQRVTDFIPNTLIQSQQVDDELNQLVSILSGVSTNKDILLKYSHATDPVLRVDQLGAGLIQRWQNNGVDRASLSALGRLLLPAGVGASPSSDQIANLGTYFTDPVARATAANTTETDFSVKTVSANTFGADGDFILIFGGVLFAANANTKRYRLYVGANVIFDTTAVAFNNQKLIYIGYMYRRTSAILSGMVIGLTTVPSTIGPVLTDVGSQDFSVTGNTLKSTGQNGTASANDITQFGFNVIKGVFVN